MGDKVKITINNKEVDGEIINFKSEKEDWNEYILEDGTKLKLKVVVSKIIRTDVIDKSGDPVYAVGSTNVVDAIVNPKLKVKKKKDKDSVQ